MAYWTASAAGLSILAAILTYGYWRRATNKRFALRLVDLGSYGLSGVGFAASLLYLLEFNAAIQRDSARAAVYASGLETIRTMQTSISENCSRGRSEASSEDLKETLDSYCRDATQHVFRLALEIEEILEPRLWLPVATPPAQLRTIPSIYRMWNTLNELTGSRNDDANRYLTSIKPESERKFLSVVVVVAALHILALSFGLGIARRTIDAYQDRSPATNSNNVASTSAGRNV